MSLWDIELLQLHVHVVVEGKGSFNLIVQCYWAWAGEEGEVMEEEEDDEDGICFGSLESQFENKETVCNWWTINLLCHQSKKMVKVPLGLAKYFNNMI